MPKLTVLMCVYNREQYVGEAIESILNQTFRDFEFLIYDDGSTDNTIKIIETFKDNRIKLIKGEINKGGLYSRQLLLDACKTEIACFMDSDDVSMPERLEKEYPLVEKDGLVYCTVRRLTYINQHWEYSTIETRQKDIIGGMFKIDKNIRMNSTRIWGSLEWFIRMEKKYPNYTILKGNLYQTRIHLGRITEIKKLFDRLIQMGKIKEEDFIHLSYPELIKFLERYLKEL